MKRKALLLIIPFAAAGLAGCERANPNPPGPTPDPQCESATVNIKSAGDVTTIKPGQTLQLTAEVNISGCTFSWSSSDPTIATVDANGLVTGVKAGDVVINYGSGKFNLSIEENPPAPLREISIADAIDLMDKAGDGKVVQEEVVVVGKVLSGSKKDSNGWNGTFEGNKLEFSSARTDEEYSSLDDCTIKVQCYLELYNGKYKIGYLPANVSPTGEKYNPKIISVQVPAGKEVKSVDSVKSAPASVAVGGTVAPSSVTLNVTLEDDTKSTVKATKVEVVTSVAAESVEGKAWYNELGPVTFNIKVVSEAPSSMKEAYLAAEALTDSKAKTEEFTFSGVIVGKRTNKNDKGEVEFFVQDGSYAIDLFNPTNKDSLAVGNKVTVTSTLCNYNGTIETTSDLKSVVVEGNADLPEATFIDSAATLSSTKVSVLANTEGVIKTIPAYSATADAKVVVTVGSDDINVFFKKNFIADFESIYKSLAVGDKITLTNGVVGDYKGRQILVIDGTQITKGETPDPGEPAINLDKYSATIAKDGEVTLTATVYNSEESVSWSVDSGEGNVTITPNGKTCVVKGVVANSSAVVKATLGTTGKSKTCNVTVKADSPVIEGIVLDFAELSKVSGTVEGVSYASAKASGASEPAYNSSNKELRLYAKNTFTISGTNITKITFDYNGCYTEGEKDPCHKATGDIVSASVGSVSAGVWTGSADSVTFTTSDSGQVHVHKVGVVCAAAKTVSELTVKTQPTKVDYNEGESFNAAGLVLHAVYSDSSEEDITSGWTISPAGALASTDNKVTVSYGGKSVDVDITVTARELQSIAISGVMSDKKYVEGENWDASGLVVMGTYNIGDPAEIDSSKYDLTFNPVAPVLGVTSVSIVASMKDGSITSEAHVETGITVTEAPVVVDFEKATSIAIGDTVALVVETATKEVTSVDSFGAVTDYVDKIAHTLEFEVVAGCNENTFAFKSGDNYLNLTEDGNKLYMSATSVTNESSWTVAIDQDGNATITNVKFTSRVMIYNKSATRVACYSGKTIGTDYFAVQIYKAPSAPVDPAVNSVTVTPETATIEVEGTTQLAAVVDVVGGASQKVNWSSSNESIATVDENGLVTAVAQGTATITATSDFDKVTADSCSITVEPKSAPEIVSVTVSPDSEDIYVGDTLQLTPTVNVKGGAAQTVTYTSDNESVATVSNSGLVTGVGDGTAHITVASTVNPAKYATATIIVSEKIGPKHAGTQDDPFTVDDAKIIYDGLQDVDNKIDGPYYVTGVIAASPAPVISGGRGQFYLEGTTNLYIYNVNNIGGSNNLTTDDIPVGATVVLVGGIKNFVKDGAHTFEMCYNKENPAISCELISVTKPTVHVTGVSFDPEEITIGVDGNATLSPIVAPSNASDKSCTYEIVSGNDKVSLSGAKVTGLEEGNAVIKATTVDGGFEATITVHVSGEAPTPAKEYSLEFTSKTDPSGLTSSPSAGNFDTSLGRAAQWSNNEGLTLTTNSYTNVTKVVLTTSTNANDDAYEISCTVGGNAFGDPISMKKGNNMELTFEDDAASGAIVITYTLKGTKKSIYVKSIVITAQ